MVDSAAGVYDGTMPTLVAATVKIATAPDRAGELVAQLQRSAVFRDYQASFETVTGLPLGLRAAGALEPPLHRSKRLNPFCGLMATHAPRTRECCAGLTESAVPVRAGTTLVGFLQTGQVFRRKPDRAGFRALLRGLGAGRLPGERQELEEAYLKTRVVAPRHYAAIIRLLASFADHLAVVSNRILVRAATAEPPAMRKAREFIAAHQREDVSLQDVARAVNMSPFYFCKLFKQATGLTFITYLGRARTESVKELLLDSQARITEAAFGAGFQSLSQFNRVFRRVAGESPSAFRHGLDREAASGTPPAEIVRAGSAPP